MRTRLAQIGVMALVVLFVGSCNLPRPSAAGTAGNLEGKTAAAQTVQALGTQLVHGTIPAPISAITLTPPAPAASATPQPAGTNPPGVTQPPAPTSAPAQASPTALPAPTTAVSAAPTQVPCDRVDLEGETIPDGTAMTPGQTFTKTWTLKNTGTCTWTSGYSVVFVSGESFGAPAATPLTTGQVAPGQSVQISLDLKAPPQDGTYRGNFKLRNTAGVLFGMGPAADQHFWVEVKVSSKPAALMDNYCLAAWTGNSANLGCPGKQGDAGGFVLRVDAPKLENGSVENEPALVTNPPVGANAQISGRFLPVTIPNGAHFRSLIGCMDGANACDVTFSLKYMADHGPVQSLGEWKEKMDQQMTRIDVDLNSLAGRSVELILSVTSASASDGQKAFWLNPHLE